MGMDGQVILPTLLTPVGNTTGNGFGDNAGDALPRQTSGIISLVTALGGRKNRGRVYVPFPSETDNAIAGHPTAGYVTALGDLAAILTGPYIGVGAGGNTNDLQPVILHRVDGSVTPITGHFERSFWATQRRRGDFGRPNTGPFG
jgi:hypothetical protein